jgi:hypothetical protein
MIILNVQKMGYVNMDWIGLAQDMRQLAGTYECGNEFSGTIKFGEFLD